ncbi:hypothetical protein EV356DRAFT_533485 [Viridothelium virens]|uniref:SEC7 domain-containing protein n=1 Tax=Viridothelium virens TaxID=1048519 RepID=A0A6A6H7A6_VIRVR|nr:hypothetical protein EV356DRAFT_533485 [Viridothelium virens]
MSKTMTSPPSTRRERATPTKLNTKNGARSPLTRISPPATPKANAMMPSKIQPAYYSNDGTFLEDGTPVDNNQRAEKDERALRDSHDLSLATHRQSLVDNMLMSLDQHGSGAYSNCAVLYNNLDDENTIPPVMSRGPFRHRGHTLSSSYSSNHDRGGSLDNASSPHSRHPSSKGRRSNSSSNFPIAIPRNGAPPLSRHGRGGMNKKDSKSSGSSSIDYGYSQVLGTSKWGMHSAHRSASVDNIYDTAKENSPAKQHSAMMERGRPVALEYWDGEEEAAPEPSVRSGPVRKSRNNSPLRVPHSSYGPRANDNNRGSPRELYQRAATDTHIPESIRRQANDFVNASTISPEVLLSDPIAPAPAVSYRKASDGPHASGLNLGGHKDRPGFFKRVFGSSKNNANSADPRHSIVSQQSNGMERGENSRPKTQANQNHIASQLRADAGPSLPDLNANWEPQRPSLQKKPSSFFRRRKRSVTDAQPPPSLPVQLNAQAYVPVPPAQPSPSISSLRKVMTPWLNGHTNAADALFDARQTVRVENEEMIYMDDPYATKTEVGQARYAARAPLRDEKPQHVGSLMPNEFTAAAEQKIKTSLMRHAQGDTFLADNSDVEDRPGPSREAVKMRSGTKEASEPKRPQTSPTSPAFTQSQSQTQLQPSSEIRSPPTSGVLSKKVSLPSQATSPQSVHTAQTHWDSTEKISPTDEETYVVTTSHKDDLQPFNDSNKSQRVWLNATESEEKLDQTSSTHLTLPFEGARSSARGTSPSSEADDELSLSAPDVRPTDEATGQGAPASVSAAAATATPFADVDEPTEEDRERALQIFNGDEVFLSKSEAAAWLGDTEAVNIRSRKAYVELFNFTDLNILAALRDFCTRLVLKGETQQIDRLLHAFSRRWCACNPNHGFKDFDVVHTISYSILLLNTDLHLADIESKMTRNQFVRNTLPTIKNVVSEAAPDAFDATIRPSPAQSRGTIPWSETPAATSPSSPSFPPESNEARTSIDLKERSTTDFKGTMKRLSMRPPIRTDSGGILTFNTDSSGSGDAIDTLVRNRFEGSLKGWEMQLEAVLKEFYRSIERQRLPLHGVDPALPARQTDENPPPTNRTNSLASTWTTSMLRRTPSMLSKTPSETASYRGRLDSAPASTNSRGLAARWTSKASRPLRPKLYPPPSLSTNGHGGNSSSRTSFEDGSGVWSPSGASSTWSRYSANRTATTLSVDSFASSRFGLSSSGGIGNAYQKSIGFANALSQAIIREEGTGVGSALASPNSGSSTFVSANAGLHLGSPGMPPDSEEMQGGGGVPLLDDERLQLIGAPWAKEGMLKHKHHLESKDKKAKTRNWNECFAVVEKGWMRLFAFNTKSISAKHKFNHGKSGPAVVGGGNWTANAEALDAFLLRQTIASALPEPGYSKSRPHVWALSLPTGAVHLFQVGTADIVREFVSTVNYWAARLSKEPLIGGVSNVEYGWSEAIIGTATEGQVSTHSRAPSHARETRSMSATSNRPPSATAALGRPSQTIGSGRPSMSSIRTSIDQGASHIGMGTMRGARLPGDKVMITDWQPPVASMMASQLLEVDQLTALTEYVKSLEEDLSKHQELRIRMQNAYSPRHPNSNKANANWERKSSYLLKEIVKFNTYIESLQRAHAKKEEVLPKTSQITSDDHPTTAHTDATVESIGETQSGIKDPESKPPQQQQQPKSPSTKLTISTETANALHPPRPPPPPPTATQQPQQQAQRSIAAVPIWSATSTESTNTPVTPTPPPGTAAEAVAKAAKAALRVQPIEKTNSVRRPSAESVSGNGSSPATVTGSVGKEA